MVRVFPSLVIGVLPFAIAACGGGDEASPAAGEGIEPGNIASQSDGLSWRTRFRTRARPVSAVIAGAGGAPAATGTGGAAPSPPPPSTSSAPSSTADIIAAAQTADGQAIPQGSGPGGACPAVVVALGFWSCPTIGDMCTYAAGGVTHHCTCSRVDGEGQSPAWICD
jgi:hypothetical protein